MPLNRRARRHFEEKLRSRRTQAVGVVTVGSVLVSQASFLAPASAASKVVVSKCTDSGSGSLRAAIETANANADNTQVTFSVPSSCTSISITSALPTMTQPIDIKGPGANKLTIDALSSNHKGALLVADTSGSFRISGLTIKGGGIFRSQNGSDPMASADVIDSVVMKQTSAFALFELNGPNPGPKLTIQNSTFTDNQIVSGSSSNYLVFNNGFDLTFKNNTVVNNSFSESMIYTQSADNSLVEANTIVKNDTGTSGPDSGDIFAGVSLFGNLIAELDTSGNEVCETNVVDQGANLFDAQPTGCTGITTGAKTNGASAVISNLTNTIAGSLNLDRGTTPTLALQAGSPAVNYYSRGDSGALGALPSKDQRGLARPYGSGYDVGALEYRPKAQSNVALKPRKITFDSGSVVLSKSQKAKIKKAVSTAPKDTKYVITGIAGDLPNSSAKEEKALAKKRANVIKKYLVKLGVSSKNIKIKTKITRTGVKPVSVLDRYLSS